MAKKLDLFKLKYKIVNLLNKNLQIGRFNKIWTKAKLNILQGQTQKKQLLENASSCFCTVTRVSFIDVMMHSIMIITTQIWVSFNLID